MDAADDDDEPATIRLELGTDAYELSRRDALDLRNRLERALAREREFVATVGRHRPDGTYVVERRRASSSGHRTVFESFEACRACFDSLPRTFTATDVEWSGVSGNRRHLLVHHFAEHPDFPCRLASRQPLTGQKTDVIGETDGDESRDHV